jgi:hypothetical protein
MKTRFIISMAMVGLVVSIWASPALSDDTTAAKQAGYYLNCINEEIDNYSCKVVHVNSRSRNLKAYGENAALRTAFLSKNKDALVQEMIAQKVSLRPHAVHQYLRQRFEQEGLVQTAQVKP